MKKKSIVLIAVLAAAIICAACESPAESTAENKAAAEEDAGSAVSYSRSDSYLQGKGDTLETEEPEETEETEETKEPEETEETEETKETEKTEKTEEAGAVSEYFTNEQLDQMRQALRIPDDLPVEIEIGTPYYWEGADIDLVQVDFYHDGEYIAGAAFKPNTGEMARNIYQYSE